MLTDIPADQKIRVFEGRETYRPVQRSTWVNAQSDTLVGGGLFAVSVRPTLFEPDARITAVTANLREVGGGAQIPLSEQNNGTYGLENLVAIDGPHGLRHLHVLIEQETSLGPYWVQLTKTIAVFPAADLPLLDEGLAAGWQVEDRGGLEASDLTQTAQIYRHNVAAAFQVKPVGNRAWNMALLPADPVLTLGFTTLHIAFHPGDARGLFNNKLTLLVNDQAVELGRDFPLDINQSEWQTLEIPLETFKLFGKIESIVFAGNLEGTFYLDDVRLIAAAAPAPPTAILEDHTATLPHSFALHQSFPNPFNSSTVIHFALPQSGPVELSLYNLAGQKVTTLANGPHQPGTYTLHWDGRNTAGQNLASGLYLYRLRAGTQAETRKLLILR